MIHTTMRSLKAIFVGSKEGTRAVHLAAGFPHELWPRSIEYFCVAKSFTTFSPIHPNDSEDSKRWKGNKV